MMGFASAEQEQRATLLRAWTLAQLDAICTSAQGVLQDWNAKWSMEPSVVNVLVVENAPQRHPTVDALQRALQGALFGATTRASALGMGSPVARDVAAQAWNDWRARVLAWAGVDLVSEVARGKPLATPGAWSGDLLLQLHWCGLDWTWLVPGETVGRIVPPHGVPLPSQPPQVSLSHALHEHAVAAEVSLSPVTLRLGDLASLAVGDIVTLPHALDQPLHLVTQNGQTPLCSGWLGQRRGHKALDLTPAPLAAPASPSHRS